MINNSMKSFKHYLIEQENKSFQTLVEENTFIFNKSTSDGILYHATSIQALYSICQHRQFHGNPHGITEEQDTLSTSINSNITQYFSSDEHKIMFVFQFKTPFKVFVLPDWLHSIHTSSGMDFDASEEEANALATEYNIEHSQWGIGENYLENNLPTGYPAFCQEYVYKRYIDTGREPPLQDEAEITFLGRGLDFLFNSISSIIVDNEEFYTVDECFEYLNQNYEDDYLTQHSDDY